MSDTSDDSDKTGKATLDDAQIETTRRRDADA